MLAKLQARYINASRVINNAIREHLTAPRPKRLKAKATQ